MTVAKLANGGRHFSPVQNACGTGQANNMAREMLVFISPNAQKRGDFDSS